MAPTGQLLIAETVMPAQNIPSQQAWIDLTMLLYVHGRERTEAEFADLLRRAGFDLVETTAVTPALSLLQAVPR